MRGITRGGETPPGESARLSCKWRMNETVGFVRELGRLTVPRAEVSLYRIVKYSSHAEIPGSKQQQVS